MVARHCNLIASHKGIIFPMAGVKINTIVWHVCTFMYGHCGCKHKYYIARMEKCALYTHTWHEPSHHSNDGVCVCHVSYGCLATCVDAGQLLLSVGDRECKLRIESSSCTMSEYDHVTLGRDARKAIDVMPGGAVHFNPVKNK